MEKPKLKGTKRLFMKLGTCSRTLGFILNRHFGNSSAEHEKALDPLAGGILQEGYQCGMLWGSALAMGTEAYKRFPEPGQATEIAISATRNVMDSFEKYTGHLDCFEITETDFQSKSSMTKYMVTGKFLSCFWLADRWAPEAILAAEEGLGQTNVALGTKCFSCASEVAKKMGASEKEAMMVAGFAGGIGLRGKACGALGAAIWMKNLKMARQGKGMGYNTSPEASDIMERFYQETDYEILCEKIAGRIFENTTDHTQYLESGGCRKLIETLAESN